MLLEFSIVPIGAGESLSRYVADVLRIVEARGLPYRLTPMGTVIEGTWDEVVALVRDCHDSVFEKGVGRVLTSIRIDDRRGRTNAIEAKVNSVMEKLGKADEGAE